MRYILNILKALGYASLVFYGQMLLAKSPHEQKVLSTEGQIQKKDGSSVVDFEETSITGARKTPMGSMVEQSKIDKNYDFVDIRKNWHPEMIKSATSLDTNPKVQQGSADFGGSP